MRGARNSEKAAKRRIHGRREASQAATGARLLRLGPSRLAAPSDRELPPKTADLAVMLYTNMCPDSFVDLAHVCVATCVRGAQTTERHGPGSLSLNTDVVETLAALKRSETKAA